MHTINALDETLDDLNFNFLEHLILKVEIRRSIWDHKFSRAERYQNVSNKLWEEIIQELNYYSLITIFGGHFFINCIV